MSKKATGPAKKKAPKKTTASVRRSNQPDAMVVDGMFQPHLFFARLTLPVSSSEQESNDANSDFALQESEDEVEVSEHEASSYMLEPQPIASASAPGPKSHPPVNVFVSRSAYALPPREFSAILDALPAVPTPAAEMVDTPTSGDHTIGTSVGEAKAPSNIFALSGMCPCMLFYCR